MPIFLISQSCIQTVCMPNLQCNAIRVSLINIGYLLARFMVTAVVIRQTDTKELCRVVNYIAC